LELLRQPVSPAEALRLGVGQPLTMRQQDQEGRGLFGRFSHANNKWLVRDLMAERRNRLPGSRGRAFETLKALGRVDSPHGFKPRPVRTSVTAATKEIDLNSCSGTLVCIALGDNPLRATAQ